MLIRPGRGMGTQSAARVTPSDIEGLVSQLDSQNLSTCAFSSGSGEDGSVLSTLGDVSGNGNHYVREAASVDNMIVKTVGTLGRTAFRKSGPQVAFWSSNTTLYSSAGTIIFFFTLPAARTETGGAVASLVNSNAYFDMISGTTPTYRKAQDGSFVDNGAIDENELIMMAVSFTDASNAEFWVNDSSTSFDPYNTYSSNGAVRIGSGVASDADPEAEYYGVLVYNRALDSTEMNHIYRWGMKRYAKSADRRMVIIGGQSNAEGRRGISSSGVPAGYNNYKRIVTLQTDQVLRQGADPVDANRGGFSGLMDNSGVGFGASMPFADAVLDTEPLQIGLVQAARGGTEIDEWARNASNPTDTTTFYGVLLTQALESKKYGSLSGLIWYQGESDAISGTTQSAYEAGLTALISALRSDLGMSTLPVLVTSLHQWDAAMSATEVHWNAIQAAQAAVASAMSAVYLVDASDLTGETGDELHLSVASYKTLGTRWASAFKSYMLG